MEDVINFNIITAEKILFLGEAQMLVIPTVTGEIGILPNHIPIISAIKVGIISVYKADVIKKIFVSKGFLEFSNNNCKVLVEYANDLENFSKELEEKIFIINNKLQNLSHADNYKQLQDELYVLNFIKDTN